MHDPARYGADFAPIYDDLFPSAPEDAIAFLAGLVPAGGSVLELGVGTGRIALPLVERGLRVHGVDASPDMVQRLRAKPHGDAVKVTLGDFADLSRVDGGPFDLVVVAFNTIFALLTQDEQLRCFRGAAEQLVSGGHFVVEAFVPGLARFARPQPPHLVGFDATSVHLDVAQHDLARQRVSSRFVTLSDAGVRVRPIEIRYAWPSEMDLMARLAGLEPTGRWGGWSRQPFHADSGVHVSAWRRP